MERSLSNVEHEADVVVLGAGSAGCVAALELLARGQQVIVLDLAPGRETASLASWPSDGYLALGTGSSFADAARQHGLEAAREIWEAYREGSQRAADTVRGLLQDCGYQRPGGLLLSRDRREAVSLFESEDLLREEGFGGEFLDHYLLEARFDTRGFTGAYWAEDEAVLDARALLQALTVAVQARGGKIYEAASASDFQLSRGGLEAATTGGRVRSAAALFAPGPEESGRLHFLDGKILRQDVGCALFSVNAGAKLPSPGRIWGGDVFWQHTDEGLVAGRFEPAARGALGETARVGDGAPSLRDFVTASFDGVDAGPAREWMETVATTRDGFPLVGPLSDLPATATCGHGRFGLGLAFLAAHWAAEAIVTGRDPTPARFRLNRPLTGP